MQNLTSSEINAKKNLDSTEKADNIVVYLCHRCIFSVDIFLLFLKYCYCCKKE